MSNPLPLKIDNAQDYLDRLIRELHALDSEKRQPLVTVLEYVSQHIRLTREEIGSLKSGDGNPLSSPDLSRYFLARQYAGVFNTVSDLPLLAVGAYARRSGAPASNSGVRRA